MAISKPPVYIALTDAEANKVLEDSVLDVAMDEHQHNSNYFKLFRSHKQAIDAALHQRTHNAVKAALEPTEWVVLEISLIDLQWLDMLIADDNSQPSIQSGTGAGWNEWHVYSTLAL